MYRNKSSKIIIFNPASSNLHESKASLFKPSSLTQIEDFSNVAPIPALLNQTSSASVEILVVGDAGSGVHSLTSRFLGERLCDAGSCRIILHQDRYVPVKLKAFHQVEDIDASSLASAAGVIIVVDSSDIQAFRKTSSWKSKLEMLRTAHSLAPLECVVAVTKFDKAVHRNENLNELESRLMAQRYGVEHRFAVSALTGKNVENCFLCLIDLIERKSGNRVNSTANPNRRVPVMSSEDNGKCVIC